MASAMGLQPPAAAAATGGSGAADPLSGLSRCLAGLCRPGGVGSLDAVKQSVVCAVWVRRGLT